jgi:hypothetical protein
MIGSMRKSRLSHHFVEIAALLAAMHHDRGRLLGRMGALGFKLREEAHLRTLTRVVSDQFEPVSV